MEAAPATAVLARELAGRERLVEALELLVAAPSRAGDELALAEAVRDWGRAAVPEASWVVEPIGDGSANLVARYPDGEPAEPCAVALYTHLDTSLSGDPAYDYPLTGVAAAPPPLERDADEARGPGLAVSKAPAACALVAFTAFATACRELSAPCQPVGVLLTAGGTHRAPSGGFPAPLPQGIDVGLGRGVEEALARGHRPNAVINVKGGSTGVLSEEPGCMLLRLEVRGPMAAVPARSDEPGAAVAAARVADAVEDWRARYVAARRSPDREIAGDAGVGAIESGLPYKPDILPAVGNVYVYVATLPEDDPETIAAELEAHVHGALDRAWPEWSRERLTTHVLGVQRGASTDVGSPVVSAARAAWEAAFGPGSSDVTGYTGSTDGVIFRRNGIDTARMGVTARATVGTPTVDRVSLDDMTAVTGTYLDVFARLA